MHPEAKDIIEKLELLPHPEGGFYRETYRSRELIDRSALDSKYKGDRNASTCIYFMLTSGKHSAFHRIHQDEIWHFYQGSAILLHMISANGAYSKVKIGNDLTDGQSPQFVVPGGTWFAAEVIKPESYALVGCTVAPGFDFEDFEMGITEELVKNYPTHSTLIKRLS